MSPMTLAGRRRTGRTTHVACIALAAVALEPVAAQEATTAARPLVIAPSVSLQQTITDNVGLSATNKRADAYTEATAAVSITSRAGRIRGVFDYALTSRLSVRDSNASDLRHTLNALGTAELIENTAFVDLRGSISQQAISPFGKQSFTSGLDNSNQSQVSTFGIAPYLKGRLGSLAQYEARVDHSESHSGATSAFGSSATSYSGRLSGGTPGQGVDWSLDASRQDSSPNDGFQYQSDRLRGTASYAFSPELTFSLIGGRESNDFLSTGKQTYNNSGARLRWIPNQRTSLSALFEKRFFGNSHAVDFSYRTPRTAWSFVDSKDAATTPEQLAKVRVGTVYDLFFAQFAVLVPDPVLRDVLVRAFLQANGINPNTPITRELRVSGFTLARIQTASVSLTWPRDTLSFRTLFSNTQRVSRFGSGNDAFDDSSRVRQRSFFVDLSHRLTPISTATLGLGYQRNIGALDEQGSTLTSINALYSTTLAPRVSLSGGARLTHFGSATQPYDEHAVFANIRVQF